jgi:hypothetical protein
MLRSLSWLVFYLMIEEKEPIDKLHTAYPQVKLIERRILHSAIEYSGLSTLV